MNVIILLLTIVVFWTGYRFFTADGLQNQVFWGLCEIASIIVQGVGKQWIVMEMNRSSLMREIKRVEVAVAPSSCKSGKLSISTLYLASI